MVAVRVTYINEAIKIGSSSDHFLIFAYPVLEFRKSSVVRILFNTLFFLLDFHLTCHHPS